MPASGRSSSKSPSEAPSESPPPGRQINLPDDLLYNIFLDLVQDDYYRIDVDSDRLWTLSAVSRQWRRVCINNPRIWAYIALFVWHENEDCNGEDKDKKDVESLQKARLHLERSRNLPLFVDASLFCGCNSQVEVFRTVLAQSSRWVEFMFDITARNRSPEPQFLEVFRSLIPANQDFSSLQRMTCGSSVFRLGQIQLPFQEFHEGTLPTLRSVTFSWIWDGHLDKPFPLGRITSLTVTRYIGSKLNLMNLLAKCGNLARLDLQYWEAVLAGELQNPAKTRYPQLTTLALENSQPNTGSILEFMEAPNLRDFTYEGLTNSDTLPTFITFLSTSSSLLTRLSLSYPETFQDEHFVTILRALPNLSYLSLDGDIRGREEEELLSCNPFLSVVISQGREASGSPLLPRLEELDLHDLEFDSMCLSQMVALRLDAPYRPMQSLKISFSKQYSESPSAIRHKAEIQRLLGSQSRKGKLNLYIY